MGKLKNWLLLFLFGSLWGINEVLIGGALSQKNAPHSSVLLIVWALFILAAARGKINKPGSSTLIGSFAALFKLANTTPFYCHLLGIFILGLTFDILSTILVKDKQKIFFKSSLTGVLSAYGNNTLFAVVMTYIVSYEYWTAGGFEKVINYILVSGSYAALIAAVVVPIGFWIGISSGALVTRHPKWTYAGTLVGIVVLWTLARIF